MLSDQCVKLIVSFPPSTNLDQIIQRLRDQYLFISSIKKHGKTELLVSFDTMSDLLEIDFLEEFGALSTKVRNSSSFCIEMKESVPTSEEDTSSNQGSRSKDKQQFKQNVQHKLKHRERLTSLQDEVVEEQQILNKLRIFSQQDSSPQILLESAKNQNDKGIYTFEEDEKPTQKQKQQSIWGPLVNGVVFTSLIVGGIKAFRLFFS